MTRKRDWLIPISLLLLGLLPILTGSFSLLMIHEALSGGTPVPDAETYAKHPFPIVTHIVIGALFMLLGPFQFISAVRLRWPRVHKTMGRMFVISGSLTALGAIWMNQFFPHFGGILKYSSNLLFGVALICALAFAVRKIIGKDVIGHRKWMIRAYAIGLGPATQRLLFMPYFVAFGIPEGNPLGTMLWFGWLINILVAEWWIRRGDRRATTISEVVA